MERFFEIDFLRSLAVILMVVFNWSFTLKFLNIFIIDGGWLYWWLFPRFIGGLFVFLAGLSVILSYNRVKDKSRGFIYRKFVFRGLKIFLIGLGITAVTWFSFPAYTIWFGILHLIGVSVLLSALFLKFRKLLLIFGLLFLVLGFYLDTLNFDFSLLFLGLKTLEFQTFDYWPLLPWFGLFLVGMFTGNLYIEKRHSSFQIPILKEISFLGRKSLIIYLIHQPLLILVLQLLGFNLNPHLWFI